MKAITTRATSFGGVLLIGLYLIISLCIGVLTVFLIGLGATFFFEIGWTVLGVILRVMEWVTGIPLAIMFVVGLFVWLYYLFKVLIRGKIES